MTGKIFRRVAQRISPHIATFMTPNQITVFNFLFFVPLASFFFYNSYTHINLLLGALCLWLRGLFDRVDGEVAHLRSMETEFGKKLDAFGDGAGVIIIVLAASLGVGHPVLGGLTILGVVLANAMVSYFNSNPPFYRTPFFIPTFYLFLGALFNQMYMALIIMSVMANVRWMAIPLVYEQSDAKIRNTKGGSIKLCLTCSSGGHYVEMLQLKGVYEKYNHFFIVHEARHIKDSKGFYSVTDPQRNPLKIIKSTLQIFFILKKEKPDVIISTGAGIGILVSYLSKILFGSKIIFIESFCRVKEKSLTGRLAYPASDLFFVQWRNLLNKYGKKALYVGQVF